MNHFTKLAERFCAWPLPAEVCADPCAADPAYAYPRSGTNLLTVAQAEQMLRHVLAGEADYRAYAEKVHFEAADGTLESLATVANMLEQYGLAELPANESDQIDFMRAIMESAVAEIRSYLVKTQSEERPAEPEVGHDVWYRGWECSYDVDAALWSGEGWRAYKGGADIDAPHVSARAFSDLLDEIEADEAA